MSIKAIFRFYLLLGGVFGATLFATSVLFWSPDSLMEVLRDRNSVWLCAKLVVPGMVLWVASQETNHRQTKITLHVLNIINYVYMLCLLLFSIKFEDSDTGGLSLFAIRIATEFAFLTLVTTWIFGKFLILAPFGWIAGFITLKPLLT